MDRDNVFEQIIEMAESGKTKTTHQALKFYFKDVGFNSFNIYLLN